MNDASDDGQTRSSGDNVGELSSDEIDQLAVYGITAQAKVVYHVSGYRYDNLRDAVAYAKAHADPVAAEEMSEEITEEVTETR